MAHGSPKGIGVPNSFGERDRVLAVELRTRNLGFAALEGPTILLDWGMRSFDEETTETTSGISERLAPLLAFHQPLVLVVGVRNYHSATLNSKLQRTLSAIRSEARRSSSKVRLLTTDRIRAYFATNGLTTKHDVAAALAMQFEELSWKLPRRRKAYHSESPAMLVFDALAIGVAYFALQAASGVDN